MNKNLKIGTFQSVNIFSEDGRVDCCVIKGFDEKYIYLVNKQTCDNIKISFEPLPFAEGTRYPEISDKEKIEILKRCFTDTIWMAIRYAHGRNTYAPDDVRKAVKEFQKVFPDWKPKVLSMEQPSEISQPMPGMKSDYLDDLFK